MCYNRITILVLCITFFVLPFITYSLTQEQIDVLNDLAAKNNISNATLISIFTEIETNFTKFYEKSYIDNLEAQLRYDIAQVNSSVNIEIIRLLESFKQNTTENVSLIVAAKLSKSEEETASRIRNIEDSTISTEEFNTTLTQLDKNDLNLQNALNNSNNLNRLFIVLAVLFSIGASYLIFTRFYKPAKTTEGIIVNPSSGEVITLEELMKNESRKSRVKNAWNLCVKINRLAIPQPLKEELTKNVYDGYILNEQDLETALEAKGVHSEKKEQSEYKTLRRRK